MAGMPFFSTRFPHGVVPGGYIPGPDAAGQGKERGELHRRIAAGAGQGGAARPVVGGEGGAHLPLQLGPDVGRLEGNAQPLRHGGGVRRPRTAQADVQVEAGDLIPLL